MSRRKPEKKPQQFGSIFSVPIDLKPGVILPGAAKHANGTVPLGMDLQTTGSKRYFYVDMFYGHGEADEKRYIETKEGEGNLRISVHRILDSATRIKVSRDIMKRIVLKLADLQPERGYSMNDVIEKSIYVCSDPKASRYEFTLNLGDAYMDHTRVIFPFMWRDDSPVSSGEYFTYPPEEEVFTWELTTDVPFANGVRFKVEMQEGIAAMQFM
eukprot:1453105-Prymnesium_polylepis.1